MAKKLLFVFAAIFCCNIFAQSTAETCESDNSDPLLDLNSITKCIVKDGENDKEKKVTFQVKSRKRVKRKRDVASGVIGNSYDQKISSVKKNTNIVNSLSLKDVEKSGAVSFYKIDEIPLFKDCAKVPFSKQQACFKKQINHHVKMNLEYPKRSYKEGIQGRVLVNFIIDKQGKVNIMNTLFPYLGEELRDEAQRIINKLPTFIPGKHGGMKANVQYSLRVMFDIPGVEKTNIRKKIKNVDVKKTYAFSELDRIPSFKNCAKNDDNSSKCFIQELQNHVSENFAYPVEAIDNDVQGIVYVNFAISPKGKIVNLRTKGPENGLILEIAAKRLIEKLPTFEPGIKENTPVYTKFQFPIEFSLEEE